jgi:hypothetical protein
MKRLNNAIKNALIFSLGAATGSLVAWRLLKTKYEQFAQDEIDSYKEYIKKKNANQDTAENTDTETSHEDEKPEEPSEEPESIVPKELLDRYRSDNYKKEEIPTVREPYIISPDDYGTVPGYDCKSLTYYADGVLTDEWDNVIENPDDIVGDDFASHFGDYDGDEDSVFVRNEGDECDYEILRDLNTFASTMYPTDHYESEA